MKSKIIFVIAMITCIEATSQSLSMDSCKYFAELVNHERAKRFKKKLEYQESSQAKLDKSAQVASIWFTHKLTEKNCGETLSKNWTLPLALDAFMHSKGHKKILMSRAQKICVGIFKVGTTYYTCVRVYY